MAIHYLERIAQLEDKQWWSDFNSKAQAVQNSIQQLTQEISEHVTEWNNYRNKQNALNREIERDLREERAEMNRTFSLFESGISEMKRCLSNFRVESNRTYKEYSKYFNKASSINPGDEPKYYSYKRQFERVAGMADMPRDSYEGQARLKYKKALRKYKSRCKDKRQYTEKANKALRKHREYAELVNEQSGILRQEEREFERYKNKAQSECNRNQHAFNKQRAETIRICELMRTDWNALQQRKEKIASDWQSLSVFLKKKRVEFYNNRANASLESSAYDFVIADSNRALKIEPHNFFALSCKGDAYCFKKEFDSAITIYSQMMRLSPNDADVFCRRGVAYKGKMSYREARSDLEEALRIDFTHKSAKANLKEVNLEIEVIVKDLVSKAEGARTKENYVYAVALYRLAITWFPQRASLYIARGQVYEDSRDYDAAYADYSKGSSKRKIDAMAHSLIAQAKRAGSKDALWYYSKVLEWYPTWNVAYILRGQVHEGSGDYDAAYADYNKGHSQEKIKAMADSLIKKAKTSGSRIALWYYSKVLKWYPRCDEVYILRGQVREANRDYDAAYADYKKGHSQEKIKAMADSLIRQAKMAESKSALGYYSKVLEWYPRWDEVYILRGQVHEANRDYDAAHTEYSKGSSQEKIKAMADSLIRQAKDSQTKKALSYYTKVLQWYPKSITVYMLRGTRYEKSKDYDRAYADYLKGNNQGKIKAMAGSLIKKAKEAKNQNELWHYNKVLEWYPSDKAVYVLRGQRYEKIGRLDLAYKDYVRGTDEKKRNLVREKIIDRDLPPFREKLNAEYSIFKNIYDCWKEVKKKDKHQENAEAQLDAFDIAKDRAIHLFYVNNDGEFSVREGVREYLSNINDAQALLYKHLIKDKKKFRKKGIEALKEMNTSIRELAQRGECVRKRWLADEFPKKSFFSRKVKWLKPIISMASTAEKGTRKSTNTYDPSSSFKLT